MADPLSSNTQAQMQALCRKISVAHDLDPEIQKELYGHMEDKLLAYLSGEEQVAEEDAFILVREHFGDPAVLKSLLQGVHAREVHVSLARHLAAAAAATMGLLVAANLLRLLITLFLVNCAARTEASGSLVLARMMCSVCLNSAAAVLLWVILRRWQRKLDRNERVWFLRWRPGWIVALIALLVVFFIVGPVVLTTPGVLDDEVVRPSKHVYAGIITAFVFFRLLPMVLIPLVWLWWMDRPPRKASALLCGFLAWLVFNPLLTSFLWRAPRIILRISQPQIEGLSESVLSHGRAFASSLLWRFSFGPLPTEAPDTGYFYGLYFVLQPPVLMALLGVTTLFLYSLVQYVRRASAAVEYLRSRQTGVLQHF
jgi:hypothetical protein